MHQWLIAQELDMNRNVNKAVGALQERACWPDNRILPLFICPGSLFWCYQLTCRSEREDGNVMLLLSIESLDQMWLQARRRCPQGDSLSRIWAREFSSLPSEFLHHLPVATQKQKEGSFTGYTTPFERIPFMILKTTEPALESRIFFS